MRMNKWNILTDIWKSEKEGKLMHRVDRATEALSMLRRSYKVKGSRLASQNSGASLSWESPGGAMNKRKKWDWKQEEC